MAPSIAGWVTSTCRTSSSAWCSAISASRSKPASRARCWITPAAVFSPPYPEQSKAGLTINDCRGVPLYTNSYPRQYYERFEDIPPLVVMSLLFIEDRGLLDASRPNANPAVDWPRFTKAAISQLEKRLGLGGQAAGGSTLATQVEKYRHSPKGAPATRKKRSGR